MKYKKGFTLIELLVVISIVSLLSSIVLTSIDTARSKARDSLRKQQVRQINLAIELYVENNNGTLPDLGDLQCLNVESPSYDCIASSSNTDGKWDTLAQELAPYLNSLGNDPCPNCNTTALIPTAFAAGQQYYEYVYEAPAAISAILLSQSIDPTSMGINNQSYRVYAKNLELGNGPFGFGVGLVSGKSEEDKTIACDNGDSIACSWLNDNNMCDTEVCKKWLENLPNEKKDACDNGDSIACSWLNDNNMCDSQSCYFWLKDFSKEKTTACNNKDYNACAWLYNNNLCNTDSCKRFAEILKKSEEVKVSCEGGDINACSWLNDNNMCDTESCKKWLEGASGEKISSCNDGSDDACSWLYDNQMCTTEGCTKWLYDYTEKQNISCEQGDGNACLWLSDNQKCTKDFCVKWLKNRKKKYCDSGDDTACIWLYNKNLCEISKGCKKWLENLTELNFKSCDEGESSACSWLYDNKVCKSESCNTWLESLIESNRISCKDGNSSACVWLKENGF